MKFTLLFTALLAATFVSANISPVSTDLSVRDTHESGLGLLGSRSHELKARHSVLHKHGRVTYCEFHFRVFVLQHLNPPTGGLEFYRWRSEGIARK